MAAETIAAIRFGRRAVVFESHELFLPRERDDTGRSAAMFGDDNFGQPRIVFRVVGVGTV